MEKNAIYIFVFTITVLFSTHAYSQQLDSLKNTQAKYWSKNLSISESTAAQIVTIMDKYKENAKKIVGDKVLTPTDKKAKLDDLIQQKNKQLSPLLTEQQFNKIVPTSERIKKP